MSAEGGKMKSRLVDYREQGWSPPRTAAGLHRPQGARDVSPNWGSTIRRFIVENAEMSLGLALAAGVALGWLIKRR